MTNQEFSDEFDVEYSNIMSNQAPGLDEYEKSVFLTKAQDEIIKAYFNPLTNKTQEGFDGSLRRQIDFSTLIKVGKPEEQQTESLDSRNNGIKRYKLPDDILLPINETLRVTRLGGGDITLQVIPLSFAEYNRLMSKPFKRPLKWQAWRILVGANGNRGDVEIVAGNMDSIGDNAYIMRYIKKPRPIIISPLEGVTIGGYIGADNNGSPVKAGCENAIKGIECELDPILHHEILQRAVELAKAAYSGDLNSQLVLGQSSATEKGIVARQ